MDLTQPQLPILETSSNAKLAIGLHLKLLAVLHSLGKLDDAELSTAATALICEMPGDKERFDSWLILEDLVPDFRRPEGIHA